MGLSPSGEYRTQAGSARVEAFERCFREHYAQVLAFAQRRTADHAQAQDVAHETFLVVWRRWEEIGEPTLPWIYGVARKVVANERRAVGRRNNLFARLRLEREPDAQALGDSTGDFARAFRCLSQADREVLRLSAWEGLSAEAAGEVLGCTANAFMVRLHRAKKKLAKELDVTGHTPGEAEVSNSKVNR